jgi:hypothetical protein
MVVNNVEKLEQSRLALLPGLFSWLPTSLWATSPQRLSPRQHGVCTSALGSPHCCGLPYLGVRFPSSTLGFARQRWAANSVVGYPTSADIPLHRHGVLYPGIGQSASSFRGSHGRGGPSQVLASLLPGRWASLILRWFSRAVGLLLILRRRWCCPRHVRVVSMAFVWSLWCSCRVGFHTSVFGCCLTSAFGSLHRHGVSCVVV